MLPWQLTKVEKSAFFPDRSTLSCCHSEMDCIIAIPISKVSIEWISLHCAQFWWHSVQKPEFTLLTIAPFLAIQQKSAYQAQYLRISWTYLDLLYRFGRRISGDDFPNIRLAVAQGTLLWQPVKFTGWSQTLPGTTLLLASAFDNGLTDCKSAFISFNGKNQATSRPNLVNFRAVILEFILLKCAIFAAIRRQFDDNFHSTCWGFQTDWKIVILISAEYSAIISLHLVEIWWNSVQWLHSLRHKKLCSRRRKFFWGDFRYVQ